MTRLVPFGAFVQLDGGIEGIIPNNELASRRVNKPEEVVQVGDHVEVKILDIRPEERAHDAFAAARRRRTGPAARIATAARGMIGSPSARWWRFLKEDEGDDDEE